MYHVCQASNNPPTKNTAASDSFSADSQIFPVSFKLFQGHLFLTSILPPVKYRFQGTFIAQKVVKSVFVH